MVRRLFPAEYQVHHPAPSASTFQTIDTSRADVARLIGRIRPAAVVVEACSLAGWVRDLCEERGYLRADAIAVRAA